MGRIQILTFLTETVGLRQRYQRPYMSIWNIGVQQLIDIDGKNDDNLLVTYLCMFFVLQNSTAHCLFRGEDKSSCRVSHVSFFLSLTLCSSDLEAGKYNINKYNSASVIAHHYPKYRSITPFTQQKYRLLARHWSTSVMQEDLKQKQKHVHLELPHYES